MSFEIESEKLTFLFAIFIEPFEGLSIKDSKFNNVDFPEPEGPTSEYILPFLNL